MHSRCIADRPLAPKTFAELDERFDSLLDALHSQLHAGAIADAERTLHANAGKLRQGNVWSIKLYSYPFESSWTEGRPQMIVRSALCRNYPGCQVNFHRR